MDTQYTVTHGYKSDVHMMHFSDTLIMYLKYTFITYLNMDTPVCASWVHLQCITSIHIYDGYT